MRCLRLRARRSQTAEDSVSMSLVWGVRNSAGMGSLSLKCTRMIRAMSTSYLYSRELRSTVARFPHTPSKR